MAVVRAVFNSYVGPLGSSVRSMPGVRHTLALKDSSKAGELTRQDYMRILRDRNQAGFQAIQALGSYKDEGDSEIVQFMGWTFEWFSGLLL